MVTTSFLLLLAVLSPALAPPPAQHDGMYSKKSNYYDGYHPFVTPSRNPSKTRRNLEVEDWFSQGQGDLKNTLEVLSQQQRAKNVILFVGDGLGVSTVTAARWFNQQDNNYQTIDDSLLSFEHFPHTGISMTYNSDAQTSDSAGTATALLAGVKTNIGVIGMNQNVGRLDCDSAVDENTFVKSILHYAQDAGKSTGIIATPRITHATPAAAYAHVPDRNFETDTDVQGFADMLPNELCLDIPDIASQLIDNNSQIQVLLGGGRSKFLPIPLGDRNDSRDLTEEWQRKKREEEGLEPEKYQYVSNRGEFNAVDASEVDYLFGLFNEDHMDYEADRSNDDNGEPSLTEMVEKAIHILEKNEEGFFLEVESGRIDHAHHANNAYKAITDTIEMSKAVTKAVELTDKEDTLIIVTADHSHVFTISGYSSFDTPILGLSTLGDDPLAEGIALADDGLPYQTLSYANGPGYTFHRNGREWGEAYPEVFPESDETGKRVDLSAEDTPDLQNKEFIQDSAVPLDSETHAGEDVAVQGPLSHLVVGTHQQHYVAHVMMYASCLGPVEEGDHCSGTGIGTDTDSVGRLQAPAFTVLLISILLLTHFG